MFQIIEIYKTVRSAFFQLIGPPYKVPIYTLPLLELIISIAFSLLEAVPDVIIIDLPLVNPGGRLVNFDNS